VAKIQLSSFLFADMIAEYCLDCETKAVELSLLPQSLRDSVANDKMPLLRNIPLDSLIHVKCVGDVCPNGFSLGFSLRNSSSTQSLKYESQKTIKQHGKTTIVTRMVSEKGFACEHLLTYFEGQSCFEVNSVFFNESTEKISLEMLTSFSLGRLNLFHKEDSPEQMRIHRFRSYWSAEGRHEIVSPEDLHLETSWTKHSVTSERFGQVGSMPVRKFFPFVAIEDIAQNVFWAAQLAYAGSWQIEVYKKTQCLEISGGIADREFGHWMKNVLPGEKFETPKAYLTVSDGSIDKACDRLVRFQARSLKSQPETEKTLPIIFNEYCTTWGQPDHKKIVEIADRLKDSEVRYLVIDAGWYAEEGKSWARNHGDWIVNPVKFPNGLKVVADEIRKRGMIPGIWFEMETVGPLSHAYAANQHFLRRDGHVIDVAGRKFWDFRDPFVFDYLKEKLISFLQKSGIGYLKVDYNETIGIGVDGAESLGEGLRQHIEMVQLFFKEIRRALPDLIIENCSSGGHRLEPSMMALADMGSFSDAHETLEIPVIAANLHRLILPVQNQIWSVLRQSDTVDRIYYSMSATFLGRMCISGDICRLNDEQYAICLEGQRFYKRVSHIIKNGISHRFGNDLKVPKQWWFCTISQGLLTKRPRSRFPGKVGM
jgi:alpha-galactosidase